MRKMHVLLALAAVAGLVVLAGCGGSYAPTLPSPGGGANLQIANFSADFGQTQIPTNLAQSSFRFEEKAASNPDSAYQLINPVRFQSSSQSGGQANVALVLDVSGSMGQGAGSKLQAMKDAAHQWVNGMRSVDSTGVITFDDRVTTLQTMTSDKTLLNSAIDNASGGGTTAVWDAGMAGVSMVDAYGQPGVKAILMMTDGEDNSSTNTRQDLVNAAANAGIPIFTIGFDITVGTTAETDLQAVADGTGGSYVNAADGSALAAAFASIQQQTQQGFYLVGWVTQLPAGTSGVIRITYLGPPQASITKTFTAVGQPGSS